MAEELTMETWDYEPLTNDVMFHMVFLNNEKARRALVSVMLNIPLSEIETVDVLNPMQHSDSIDAKLTVLDLRIHLNDGAYVNLEMQVKRFEQWTNRTVVYSCRQVVEQTNVEGFDYDNLEPVIHVAIMNHTLFEDHKRFFARYRWQDDEGYLYSDKMQFYVMDLKAIDDATDEDKERGLVQWAEAFVANNWEEIKKIENPGIKEAVKQMQTIMSTPTQREIVWRRKMAQMDYNSAMKSALKRGEVLAYAKLVNSNQMTLEKAAENAGLSVKDFAKQAGIEIKETDAN